jgi:PAS domain S-box-containing protein
MKMTQPAERVLVVEDEAIVAMDISVRLRALGYEVLGPAATGAEALEFALRSRPDLVLMDIMLRGGMDGVEAARRIRESTGAPIVYLTAYADESTLRRAKVAEPLGYLLKPFEERELRTTIETALHKHRTEARLRESERWLATTLRSIGEAVIAADERGRVRLINPSAEALTGWPQSEALGRDLSEVFQLEDEATGLRVEPTTTANAAADARHANAARQSDVLLLSRDGRSTPVETNASVITDEKGEFRGSVLIFKDISERRRLAAQLLRSEKLAAVGQLAAGMAHELNNPLTPALLYTRRLLRQGELGAEARGHLEVVVREVERAQDIIKDLLAFARRYRAEWGETDINVLLRRALERAESEAPSLKVSSRFEPGEGVRVLADEYRLTQVFLNIIRNARQAIEEGGREGTVTIRSERVASGGEERVRVHVSDDGPGIARENLPKIFDPFFTTRQVGAGAGLGLSLSNGIVEEHGGAISVESEPGAGATFVVELPA